MLAQAEMLQSCGCCCNSVTSCLICWCQESICTMFQDEIQSNGELRAKDPAPRGPPCRQPPSHVPTVMIGASAFQSTHMAGAPGAARAAL